MKKSNDYPVAFLGNFSEVPPADVLYSLACQDETGVLDVRHDKVLKRIYFEGGRIVAVTSNLARDGLITRAKYRSVFLTEEGRALAKECRQRHEIVLRFLLSLGLDPETAERDAEGIEHHVSERTLALFAAFAQRS